MTPERKNELVGFLVVTGGALLLNAAANHFKRKAREQEARIRREKELASLTRTLKLFTDDLDRRIYNTKFAQIIKENNM